MLSVLEKVRTESSVQQKQGAILRRSLLKGDRVPSGQRRSKPEPSLPAALSLLTRPGLHFLPNVALFRLKPVLADDSSGVVLL